VRNIRNSIDRNSIDRNRIIEFGDQKISFTPESKRWLDIELMLLHIPLLILIFSFAYGFVNVYLFLFLFYCLGMRIFIGNHDRFHADNKIRLPRWIELISENLWVAVTPWDETFDSVRKKHLKHHATHGPGKKAVYDLKNDPHCVYEDGGFFKVFLSCFFYEELQLFLDITYSRVTRSRLYRILIYLPLQIIFIYFFGWSIFLFVFLGWRIVGFSGWFFFSYVIHQPFVYKFGFSRSVPKVFKLIFTLIHGRRIAEGVLHHATHHAWPSVSYKELNKIDSSALENAEYAPEMIALS